MAVSSSGCPVATAPVLLYLRKTALLPTCCQLFGFNLKDLGMCNVGLLRDLHLGQLSIVKLLGGLKASGLMALSVIFLFHTVQYVLFSPYPVNLDSIERMGSRYRITHIFPILCLLISSVLVRSTGDSPLSSLTASSSSKVDPPLPTGHQGGSDEGPEGIKGGLEEVDDDAGEESQNKSQNSFGGPSEAFAKRSRVDKQEAVKENPPDGGGGSDKTVVRSSFESLLRSDGNPQDGFPEDSAGNQESASQAEDDSLSGAKNDLRGSWNLLARIPTQPSGISSQETFASNSSDSDLSEVDNGEDVISLPPGVPKRTEVWLPRRPSAVFQGPLLGSDILSRQQSGDHSLNEAAEAPEGTGEQRARRPSLRSSRDREKVRGAVTDLERSREKPFFSSNTKTVGRTILSVTRVADFVALGEETIDDRDVFDICSSCGGFYLSTNVKGSNPNKICLWQHWSKQLQLRYPELEKLLRVTGGRSLRVLRGSASVISKIPGLRLTAHAARNPLTALIWITVKQTTREIRRQQLREQQLNIGRAFNTFVRKRKELQGPLQIAFFLLSGLGCKSEVPYTDRYREGVDVSRDMKSCLTNPLLQRLADNPAEALAWVPPSLPSQINVTISAEIPPDQRRDEWRLPLYRLWHLLWFQIFEGYRLDHLWDWMKKLDTTELFPGWEVKAVGVAHFTEHRPVPYANGVWRFANIEPNTLELERQADGRYKNPFELNRPSEDGLSVLDDCEMGDLAGGDSAQEAAASSTFSSLLMRIRGHGRRRFSFFGGDSSWASNSSGKDSSRSAGDVSSSNDIKAKNGNRSDISNSSSIHTSGRRGVGCNQAVLKSTDDDNCPYVEVSRQKTFVSFNKCGVVLKINKPICDGVATFDYVNSSPYAVLLSPLQETLQQANFDGQAKVNKDAATHTDSKFAEEKQQDSSPQQLKQLGWSVADAVWVFRPTTGTKTWALNTLVTPLQSEPLLSKHPHAKMHRGYNIFFRRAVKDLVDEFVAALAAASRGSRRRSSSAIFSSDGRSNGSYGISEEYLGLGERFTARTKAEPFTVVFSGLSSGGALAGIASIYFAREMKRKRLDRDLRVMCVAFGAPSWGSPKMYAAFDRLKIIWNEVWTGHDPVPELFAGEDILGLAYNRRQIILRGQDWGKVQLSQPFVFDGSEWLKGTEDLGLWRQIVAWYFDLHRLLTLPLHPKIAHQHEYSAALSLMSGFYKYAGWMSHLAVPWIPLPKMEVTTFPETMEILEEVHAKKLGLTDEAESADSA